jgi:hypothetical protein
VGAGAGPRRAGIGTWLARGVLAVGLLVLAGLLVLGGLAAWIGYNLSHQAPAPDVQAQASTGAVRRADAQTAAWFRGQLAQLGREAPWLRPAGQSVHDQCRAASDSSGGWITICSRIQTGYYAYAGSGRVGALERALYDLGWREFTVTPQGLNADYTVQAGPPKTGLQVSWISPATPAAVSGLVASYTAAFGQHPRAGEDGVLQATPPDPGRIMGAAAPPDEHLFIVTLQVTYASSPPSS